MSDEHLLIRIIFFPLWNTKKCPNGKKNFSLKVLLDTVDTHFYCMQKRKPHFEHLQKCFVIEMNWFYYVKRMVKFTQKNEKFSENVPSNIQCLMNLFLHGNRFEEM